MALTNAEKSFLWHAVMERVKAGKDIKEITTRLKRHGYKDATIRSYYKAVSRANK